MQRAGIWAYVKTKGDNKNRIKCMWCSNLVIVKVKVITKCRKLEKLHVFERYLQTFCPYS